MITRKSIVESQQWSREDLEHLFQLSDNMRHQCGSGGGRTISLKRTLYGYTMYYLFYEPSTRTRFSFQAAAINLGMDVIGSDNAGEFSSAVKGETLEHSIRVTVGYGAHVIVLRHPQVGAAQRAAAVCREYNVSLINAGDGTGQHPTQALLDVYTIQREMGHVDSLTVVIGGDLAHGRTAKSLSYLLSKFKDIRIIFVSPPQLAMSQEILDHLDKHHVYYEQAHSLRDVLRKADVVYWTRIQKERHAVALSKKVRKSKAADPETFQIGLSQMGDLKATARLMHPLPIARNPDGTGGEILAEVDDHPKAAYFRQASSGLYVRMALLNDIMIPNGKGK